MRRIVYLLAFLTLVFTGCSNRAPNVIVNVEPYSNIVFEADSTKDWFVVENAAVLHRDDKLTEIEIVGKNRASSTQFLTYKIDWYDENGFVIKSILSTRKIASVEAGRNIVIHAVSPSENANTYKIRIGVPSGEDELRDKNVNVREYRGE
jgi:uncharacterized protein YcfL